MSLLLLTRLTIVMGAIALCMSLFYNRPAKNIQLGRQNALPQFKLDQDIVQRKYDGLIQLVTADKYKGFCSGFVISNSYAVTAAHCLVDEDGNMKNAEEIKVRSIEIVEEDGTKQQTIMPIEIVGLSLATDYALLIGDFSDFTTLKINTGASAINEIKGTQLLPGISVPMFAVGFPLGGSEPMALPQQNCQTLGETIMCQGIMFRGCSGGFLIDPITGVVVGINHAINLQGQETFFKFMIAIFDQFNVETY